MLLAVSFLTIIVITFYTLNRNHVNDFWNVIVWSIVDTDCAKTLHRLWYLLVSLTTLESHNAITSYMGVQCLLTKVE